MELKISINKLAELYSRGYNGDIILLLLAIKNNEDIPDQIQYSKTEAKCVRKGLISGNKLTKVGEELLEFLDKPETEKFEKKKLNEDVFLRFWQLFPATDSFEYKGRSFLGSRGLRVKKDDCRIKLNAILSLGEYNIEDILRATEYDIFLKKEQSFKTGQNKLSYIHNSLTYLNQLSFEPFIELSRGKTVEKETKQFDGINI